MTIYIDPKKFIAGFAIGALCTLILLGVATIMPPAEIECPPRCVANNTRELIRGLDNAKVGLFEYTKVICLDAGESIDGAMLSESADTGPVTFECQSEVCSGESPNLLVLNGSIQGMEWSMFRTVIGCTGAASENRCMIRITDSDASDGD